MAVAGGIVGDGGNFVAVGAGFVGDGGTAVTVGVGGGKVGGCLVFGGWVGFLGVAGGLVDGGLITVGVLVFTTPGVGVLPDVVGVAVGCNVFVFKGFIVRVGVPLSNCGVFDITGVNIREVAVGVSPWEGGVPVKY